MFNRLFDLCIAANNSSLDIVLLMGESRRFAGESLRCCCCCCMSAGFGETHRWDCRANLSATVGVTRPTPLVGVDDLKPFECSGPIGEIGTFFWPSWIVEAKNR